MVTTHLKSGDIIEVDKGGRRFFAIYKRRLPVGAALTGGAFQFEPITHNISYHRCNAPEIVGIWHANKTTRGRHASLAEAVA